LGGSNRPSVKNMNVIVALYGLLIIGVLLGSYYGFLCVVSAQAKKEVMQAPKVPMYTCDIHGMFPASSTLKIGIPSAPGQSDLDVDMCPFCFTEKMDKAKQLLKS
jgi:hypothetical protein